MHPARPPQFKAGDQQQKQQKEYKLMETEQLSTEWEMDQDRNEKEIKGCLEFHENEYTAYLNF